MCKKTPKIETVTNIELQTFSFNHCEQKKRIKKLFCKSIKKLNKDTRNKSMGMAF